MVELSVVMPAYNEADNLPAALDEIVERVLSIVPDSEIIVIDDGSTDGTADVLQTFSAREARLRVTTQQNSGHGAALMNGLDNATGRVLLLLDSDREIPLDQFADHWEMMGSQRLAAVFGVRQARQFSTHRRFVTGCMRLLVRLLFGLAPRDANAPYKLISLEALNDVRGMLHPACAIPSVVIATSLLRAHPSTVREVEVPHIARRAGTSTLRLGRLGRLCLRATGDLLKLRRDIR